MPHSGCCLLCADACRTARNAVGIHILSIGTGALILLLERKSSVRVRVSIINMTTITTTLMLSVMVMVTSQGGMHERGPRKYAAGDRCMCHVVNCLTIAGLSLKSTRSVWLFFFNSAELCATIIYVTTCHRRATQCGCAESRGDMQS